MVVHHHTLNAPMGNGTLKGTVLTSSNMPLNDSDFLTMFRTPI